MQLHLLNAVTAMHQNNYRNDEKFMMNYEIYE